MPFLNKPMSNPYLGQAYLGGPCLGWPYLGGLIWGGLIWGIASTPVYIALRPRLPLHSPNPILFHNGPAAGRGGPIARRDRGVGRGGASGYHSRIWEAEAGGGRDRGVGGGGASGHGGVRADAAEAESSWEGASWAATWGDVDEAAWAACGGGGAAVAAGGGNQEGGDQEGGGKCAEGLVVVVLVLVVPQLFYFS